MDALLKTIYEAVLEGDSDTVTSNVNKVLADGVGAEVVLNSALIASMDEVGRLFEAGDLFVPEMLIASRAMQSGLNILKPYLVESGIETAGKVVIGTVAGDLHDIGKNLVAMMLEGAGFEIIDLGTDVTPEQFVDAVKEYQPHLIGMSALLTTTMRNMQDTIDALNEEGIRDQVKVMIGGAPVVDSFAKEIGADGFASDASRAVALAKELVR